MGCQLGVQGLKGAAGPAGAGAAATGGPGVGGLDLAVEGRLRDREKECTGENKQEEGGCWDGRDPGSVPLTYLVAEVVAEPGARRAAGKSGGPRAGPLGMESAVEEWSRRG